MSFVVDYLRAQKEYIEQYGDKTVLIIQKGIFYEIYEYDPAYCLDEKNKLDKNGVKWLEKIGHAVDVSYILTTDLTQPNGNKPYTVENCHMTGFPIISYEKNKIKLLANNYAIVRVDQKSGNASERNVAEICSPTLDIEVASNLEKVSNIVSLYIDNQTVLPPSGGTGGTAQGFGSRTPTGSTGDNRGFGSRTPTGGTGDNRGFDKLLLTVGVAVLDVLSGKNKISEFYSKVGDEIFAMQELFRFILSNYPNELIINVNDLPATQAAEYTAYLEKNLQLARFNRVTINFDKIPKEYKKIEYQEQFLTKAFAVQKKPTIIVKSESSKRLEKPPGKSAARSESVVKSDTAASASPTPKKIISGKIISELNLENMQYGRIAYLALLQFCHNYNPNIITRLDKPDLKWLDENKHCILTHNAILQLDLGVGSRARSKKITGLASIINKTVTKMGSKKLINLLQNPLYDQVEICKYYDLVEAFSLKKNGEFIWTTLERKLKEITDIELLQRKLYIGILLPKEFALLYMNYIKFLHIYIYLTEIDNKYITAELFSEAKVTEFNNFISIYNEMIDFTALECCSVGGDTSDVGGVFEFTTNPFPTLEQENTAKLLELEAELQSIVEHLDQFIENTRGQKITFKSEKSTRGAKKKEASALVLTTTKAKSKLIVNSAYNSELCGDLTVVSLSSTDDIITSEKIKYLTDLIEEIKVIMKHNFYKEYQKIIANVRDNYTFHILINDFIAKIDVIHCYAKIAYQNNYYRPTFIASAAANTATSMKTTLSVATANTATGVKTTLPVAAANTRFKDLRHPIIEKLIDGKYIPNDIEFEHGSGILLYGVNQTGKSSLAKSIALNIIMAQMGCYTACELTYKPYSKIITRLSGNDNIFADQSSFAVEMTELRTILRQSDENTLIIGDELARGTESDSATAITISTILSLIKSKSNFIFATHMHNLTEISYIKEIPTSKLRICHLAVTYDEKTDELIYNRKLQDGPGSAIYGLTVAKSLNLPHDFISKAQEVLQHIDGRKEFLSLNKSKYNPKLYVDSCFMCGSNKNLHTHHIIEQKYANDQGYIANMDKNKKDNLLILCEDCHKRVHATT